MLAPAKVYEIERLLATGKLSQRGIAKQVGVSRAVVGLMASGDRPDYEALRRVRADEHHRPTGPLTRCPGCGGKAYLPCLLCRIRALKTRDREILRATQLQARQRALRELLSTLRHGKTGRDTRPASPRPASLAG